MRRERKRKMAVSLQACEMGKQLRGMEEETKRGRRMGGRKTMSDLPYRW